jgi:hypothetical protein
VSNRCNTSSAFLIYSNTAAIKRAVWRGVKIDAARRMLAGDLFIPAGS